MSALWIGLWLLGGCGEPSPSLAIYPLGANTTDDLRLRWTAALDEQSRLVRYEWSRNDEVIHTLTDIWVPAKNTARDERWAVRAIGPDGVVGESKIRIRNAPPSVTPTLVPLVPDRLTGIHGDPGITDPDGDDVTWSMSWTINDVTSFEGGGQDLNGNFFERDDEIVVTVTASDGDLTGVGTVSTTVGNARPSIQAALVMPSDPTRNDTLRCKGAGWEDLDQDPESYHYTWWVNEVLQDTEDEMMDADSLRPADEVVCVVAPFDGREEGDQLSSESVQIVNAPPTLSGTRIAPGQSFEDSLLTCEGSGFHDPDGDLWEGSEYAWYVNGVLVSTSDVLDGADFDKGDEVTCEHAPHDGLDAGPSVTSDPVVILNSPPTDVVITTEPDPVYPHDLVRCHVSAYDADGDAITWNIAWERDGAPFIDTVTTEHPNDTIPAYGVGFDELWRCIATPDDGTATGDTMEFNFSTDAPVGGNVLLIVADDLGIDNLGLFGLAPNPPPTPTIDSLAAEGVLFNNAYAYSVCSPTRGALMTGRYGRRTGAANVIPWTNSWFELSLDEVTLPEMLAESPWYAYANTAVGKWHLGSFAAPSASEHPILSGFDAHAGSPGNLDVNTIPGTTDYYHWQKLIDGAITTSDTYATTDTTDDAIAHIAQLPEPWFAYVAYNAPHSPWHVPPADLHGFVGLNDNSANDLKYDAAVEALDTEMGRLLASLSADMRARTTVIFLADNGTPTAVITAPFDLTRGKNTPYEGGIHVPMIISGPLVSQPGTTTDALVHAVDVYPTVAHIAGVRLGDMTKPDLLDVEGPIAFDGQSLVRWLDDPSQPSVREALYMEQIAPNGGPEYTAEDIGIARDGRWKVISYPNYNEFYDLTAAVYDEGVDLLPGPLGPAQQNGFDLLRDVVQTTQSALAYEGPVRP